MESEGLGLSDEGEGMRGEGWRVSGGEGLKVEVGLSDEGCGVRGEGLGVIGEG